MASLAHDAHIPSDPPHASAAAGNDVVASSVVIRTPDQRVRVFVSSTLDELAPERQAVREAITRLHLIPVMFDSGAHPHPPRDLYRAYLAQSAVFVGLYWQRYGWVAPGMDISGLEDEYRLAGERPKLIYIKTPAPEREPRLQTLLDQVRVEEVACYQRFSTPEELSELLQNDLALLLTEHFEQARQAPLSSTAHPPDSLDLPSGTVTFLFTDIEGSTRLLQELGDRYANVLGAQQQLMRAVWATHHGQEVDTQGDSFFVVFARAPDAVAAAGAAQRALAEYAWPQGGVVRVRMGLHTGTPQLVGGQYIGLDVHRAARIAAAGHGGQVLLSEATYALTEHALPEGASVRDLGAFRLKDLQHPEQLFQLLLPGLPADFPPLKTLDRQAHNLPIQPTPLLGREDEVAGVCALLRRDDVRLVTLTGPAGVGKTRLVLQVAAELVDEYADGVWFVRLSRLADPGLVLPTIAQTLGLRETGSQSIEEVLREYVRTRHLLLVLDNFEHVVGAAAGVAELLTTSPNLTVLVTSRTVLHLRGEKEVPVPPLGLPSAAEAQHLPAPERLSQYAAVALFLERARDAQPDFQVTDATAPAVAAICTRLDGLPLALELAAAKVKLLPPSALLQRLEHQLPLLTGGARDLEERQQTMHNTLAWSYDLLAPAEQRLFQRLAAFVGGCTLEAAEAVCAAPAGVAPLGLEVLEGLSGLVDQSLVQQRTEGAEADEPHIGMLQVIREYALEQLEASGEHTALRQAHADYFLTLAERAEPELMGPEAGAWLGRLEREHDNLRTALAWTRRQQEVALGLRLAGALSRFWHLCGHLSEGRDWLDRLLALEAADQDATGGARSTSADNEAVPRKVRAKALYAAGELASYQDDLSRAVPLLEQSLTLAREAGETALTARVLNRLGTTAQDQGDLGRATTWYEESLALAQQLGDQALIHTPLANLALVAYERGDLQEAEARSTAVVALDRQAGDSFQLADDLTLWANIRRSQGDLPQTFQLLQEAFTIHRDVSAHGWPVLAFAQWPLVVLARTLAEAGRSEQAARFLGVRAALLETLGIAGAGTLDHADIGASVAPARAALGEQAWAAAYAAGQALTLEEAIAEALKETGGE